MLVPQTLLLDGQLYQFEREHSFQTDSGGWVSPRSFMLACPWCGKVWAHSQIGSDRWLQPRAVPCAECPPSPEHWLAALPGSIFPPLGFGLLDWPMLEALPESLLRRELYIQLSALE